MYLKISLALPLSKVETNISSLMRELIRHYLKLKLYPEHISQNHWKVEIKTWLSDIKLDSTRVKTPSGKVKPQILARWILAYITDDSIEVYIEYLQDKYGKSAIEITSEQIRNSFIKIIPLLLDNNVKSSKVLEVLLEV